jgi:hypothetical protein
MTQRQTVLAMLRRADKYGITNGAFAEAGILRYSARIEELRKAGYPIVKQRVSAACWKYTLLQDSTSTATSVSGAQSTVEEASLPRLEYQAGAGAAVEAERLFEVPPVSHYQDAA